MIFQHTLNTVLNRNKNQTRRLVKPGETLAGDGTQVKHGSSHLKWAVGRTYAVQPGRGKSGIARILITDIRQEDVRLISDTDVRAEGFTARAEFLDLWREMHGENYHAWVVEFELSEVYKEGSTA